MLTREGSSLFNIRVTSASFNLFRNSTLTYFQCLRADSFSNFRSFWGIPFDVVAFLGLIRFSSLSISDKPTSLNENLGIFFNLLLISKTLGWILYMFIALSISLLSVSMI